MNTDSLAGCGKLRAAAAECEVRRVEFNDGKILVNPFIADLIKWNVCSSYADGALITSGKRAELAYPYESVTFEIAGYEVQDNPEGGANGLNALLWEWSKVRGWSPKSSKFGDEVEGYVNRRTFENACYERFFPKQSLREDGFTLASWRREVAVGEIVEFADDLFKPRSKVWINIFDLFSPGGVADRELAICVADLLEEPFLELGESAWVIYHDAILGQREEVSFIDAANLAIGALVV